MRALVITQAPARRSRALRRLAAAVDLILAADGGARVARAAAIVPHLLIGDFDSLDEVTRRWSVARRLPRRRFPSAKDATDAELALREARRRGAREVWLYGVVAGRLDQTVANLLLLFAARRLGVALRLTDGRMTAWLAERRTAVTGRRGDLVSLIPISEKVSGITTAGLRYRLRGGTLRRGSTRGVSNEIARPPAVVRVGTGELLVIHLPAR